MEGGGVPPEAVAVGGDIAKCGPDASPSVDKRGGASPAPPTSGGAADTVVTVGGPRKRQRKQDSKSAKKSRGSEDQVALPHMAAIVQQLPNQQQLLPQPHLALPALGHAHPHSMVLQSIPDMSNETAAAMHAHLQSALHGTVFPEGTTYEQYVQQMQVMAQQHMQRLLRATPSQAIVPSVPIPGATATSEDHRGQTAALATLATVAAGIAAASASETKADDPAGQPAAAAAAAAAGAVPGAVVVPPAPPLTTDLDPGAAAVVMQGLAMPGIPQHLGLPGGISLPALGAIDAAAIAAAMQQQQQQQGPSLAGDPGQQQQQQQQPDSVIPATQQQQAADGQQQQEAEMQDVGTMQPYVPPPALPALPDMPAPQPPAPPTGNWLRKCHEMYYLADKAQLDGAKLTGQSISISIIWANMPSELCARLPQTPAPVEVAATATVGTLKRAICRALGGNLWPTVLREPTIGTVLEEKPTDHTLVSYGITNSMLLHMEADYLPLPEGLPGALQRPNGQGLLTVGGSNRGSSSQGGASNSGRPTGTKERFTLSEMFALVEGIERFGLKWAKIHKETPDLENKSQGDLKDKWRNWQKNVHNGWTTARVYMPDDLKARIEKLVAEHAVPSRSGEGQQGQASQPPPQGPDGQQPGQTQDNYMVQSQQMLQEQLLEASMAHASHVAHGGHQHPHLPGGLDAVMLMQQAAAAQQQAAQQVAAQQAAQQQGMVMVDDGQQQLVVGPDGQHHAVMMGIPQDMHHSAQVPVSGLPGDPTQHGQGHPSGLQGGGVPQPTLLEVQGHADPQMQVGALPDLQPPHTHPQRLAGAEHEQQAAAGAEEMQAALVGGQGGLQASPLDMQQLQTATQ